MKILPILTAVFLLFMLSQSAAQAQFIDAANDFLPTYTAGPLNGDLDVISSQVTYTGSSFIITATMNGNIGTTAGAIYVWGFDRGQGTARFSPALANTENVLFDSVVTLRPDTTVSINRLVGGGATNLGVGTVQISGRTLTATIASSELPVISPGVGANFFTWNLWPRLGAGNNNQISDFAPNNSNVRVVTSAAAPEPASLSLLACGVLSFCGYSRTRRKRN